MAEIVLVVGVASASAIVVLLVVVVCGGVAVLVVFLLEVKVGLLLNCLCVLSHGMGDECCVLLLCVVSRLAAPNQALFVFRNADLDFDSLILTRKN